MKKIKFLSVLICMAFIFTNMPIVYANNNDIIETGLVTESDIHVPDEYVTAEEETIKEYNVDLDFDISTPNYASYEYEKTVTIDNVLFDSNGQIDWDTFPIEKAKEIYG